MTHRTLRLTVAGAVALFLLALGSGVAASEKIARHEDLVCTSCHDKPGSKLLTDEGKYYELMGTRDGFTEVKASFDRCTSCHVRKPGSKKLTKKGETFASMVGDMEGLREWAKSQNPDLPCAPEDEKVATDDKDDESPR